MPMTEEKYKVVKGEFKCSSSDPHIYADSIVVLFKDNYYYLDLIYYGGGYTIVRFYHYDKSIKQASDAIFRFQKRLKDWNFAMEAAIRLMKRHFVKLLRGINQA